MKKSITVFGGEMDEKEQQLYWEHVEQKNPNRYIEYLELTIDGDYVNMKYELVPIQFDRIRRITGYLVGTTNRWNNAKQAELRDRVTHGISANN